jgi:hypothetical protein
MEAHRIYGGVDTTESTGTSIMDRMDNRGTRYSRIKNVACGTTNPFRESIDVTIKIQYICKYNYKIMPLCVLHKIKDHNKGPPAVGQYSLSQPRLP